MSTKPRAEPRRTEPVQADRALDRLIHIVGLSAEGRRRNEMGDTTIAKLDPIAYKEMTREAASQNPFRKERRHVHI
jgi:hypothetical protein